MKKKSKAPKIELLPDEFPDIMDELKRIFGDPEPWLDEPNLQFLGRTPHELIGTDQEIHLRNWVRRYKHGIPS
jgi:hypothetical protein